MLNKNQTVLVSWNNANKDYYISLGYKYTKNKEKFEVKVSDLQKSSGAVIEVICDYCNNPYYPTYKNYNKTHIDSKDCCSKCRGKKAKDTMLEKYGAEHYSKTDEYKVRVKQTCKEKYGTISVSQVEEIKSKKKETNLVKFGSEWYVSSDKFKQQCLNNLGVDNPMKNVEIQKKATESLIKNGNVPVSSEERKMVSMLKEIYGENNCNPSCQCGRFTMDCLLFVNNIKIDVEYDGLYWHQQRKHYDSWRDNKIIQNGYKVLRIISSGKMPGSQEIINAVNCLVDTDIDLIKINVK